MLRLVTFGVSRETIAVLLRLVSLARAGKLRGIAVCYWIVGTGSEVALTGLYHADPEKAFAAAARIKVTAAHQLDLFA